MTSKTVAALRRMGKGRRGVEDAVSFSLGHRIRIEIRAALHEGPATAAQLAAILGEPRSTIEWHIREMLNDGTIDIAKTVTVRNLDQHYYCVVKLPYFSDAEVAAMAVEDRQALYAMIVQAAIAEALASLWAGKMVHDPRIMLAWNRIFLDQEGRSELADEEACSWNRKHEIEARAANRIAESGEPGVSYVITSFAYERGRTSAPPPLKGADQPGESVVATGNAAAERFTQAGGSVEDAVSFSLGHRIRIEIRAALHEGPATAAQLAKIIHQPRHRVLYHLDKMVKAGSIAIAKSEKVGNVHHNYYGVVDLPYFSDEDVAAMSIQNRQALYAMIVQAASAEALASLWAGKMARDTRVMVAWNRINLDRQGRAELADEEAASWCRKHRIEVRSANRLAKTGESGVAYVITSFSFARSRTSAPTPLTESYLDHLKKTD